MSPRNGRHRAAQSHGVVAAVAVRLAVAGDYDVCDVCEASIMGSGGWLYTYVSLGIYPL